MSNASGSRASTPVRLVVGAVTIVKKLGRVIPQAIEGFFADQCPQQAAAIAYRVLFSIAPLAIVLVSVFGLVLRNDSLRHDVINTIVDALPVSQQGENDVEDAIVAIATPASATGLVALLLFAWASTGMMTALRKGLEAAMSVRESRPVARGKLIDLALVVGAALLVLVSVGLTVLGTLVQRGSDTVGTAIGLGAGTLASGLLHTGTFIVSIGVVLLVYRFVPARGLGIRDGLTGAIVTAVLLKLIALGSSWIYDRTAQLSVVFGSLTAALVFLYSMYLYASALLLGAEVASVWSRPPTGPGEPIRSQLQRALVGLFISQKPPPEPTSPAEEVRSRESR
jgi:membrane protein